MKRIGLIVGVLVLSLGLMLGQIGISQMGQRGSNDSRASDNAISTQMETHLLRAIGEAGLSVEQMRQIQSALDEVRSADQVLQQRREELRDFLYGWQGEPEELDSALASPEQALDEARQAYQNARRSAVAELQNLLTIAQGRALHQAFHSGMGTNNAPGHGARRGRDMGQRGRGAHAGQGQQMRHHESGQGMADQGGSAPPSQRGMPPSAMAQGQNQGPPEGRMSANDNASAPGGAMQGGMHGNCPMMNRGRMGAQQGMQGSGAGIGPIFMEHMAMWQQVIGEKLDRLQGEAQ